MVADFLNSFQITGNLYFTDFLDILIISALLYSLFIFLRRSRTYMIFFGLAIAFGMYALAKTFNLYLTLLTLRYFVGVSLVIFVIIFQNEIRKYFEFLGLIGTRQIRVGPLAPKGPSTNDIIQACVQMAQAKIGALIVIQGKDSIESYVDGGTALDGVISEELLMSIFDPHSIGHDGAVIINNNRISKFGAHLPLSTNFKEIGKHGTRHGAALGISEVADPFCIVISEEKGKISICKEGKMKTLNQFADLEKELEKYIKTKFDIQEENYLMHLVKHNSWLKVGALVSAILIWFFTAYQAGIMEKTYTVPVTLENLPKSVSIENYSPQDIEVTVSGRGNSVFDEISAEDFALEIDASSLKDGVNQKSIERKDLSIPTNMTFVNAEPNLILLTAKKYYSVQVPVQPDVRGQVAENLQLDGTVITPQTVEVWVPEGQEAPRELTTEAVDISSQTESVIIPVKVIVPNGYRLLNGNSTVNIALTIEERQ